MTMKWQFSILRAVRREYNKFATLGFGRADLALFRDLLGSVPWHKALKGRRTQEN